MNKKGQVLGGTISMVFATIAVILILLVFAIGSQLIKWADDDKETGVDVINESEVGLGDVFVYMKGFNLLHETRYLIESGNPLAGELVKYEEKIVEINKPKVGVADSSGGHDSSYDHWIQGG